MMRPLAISAAFAAGPAIADIVVDVPVTASLVESVLDAPVTVLLEGSSDSHGATLRPSQARALRDADLIVHLGSGFNPPLERAIAEAGLPTISLAGIAGMDVADDPHDDHDEHGDDSRAEHGDDDDHAEGEADDEHGHGHADGDPHVWLDYYHLDTWLAEITERAAEQGLATHDGALAMTAREIEATIRENLPSPMPEALITHDIWSRLTDRLELRRFDVIGDSHAAAPGARHVSDLRARAGAGEIDCILAAPGDAMAQAETLAADFDLSIVSVDPWGDASLSGIERYLSIFTGFAAALRTCQANAT